MKSTLRWTKNTLIFGGTALWGAMLVSCVMVNRAIVVPPQIAGAKFVGTKDCAECHEGITQNFQGATHAKLMLQEDGKNIGCEACHGPGSLHSKSGGNAGTIVNPAKNPETCFQCHLDKRGEFALPYAHSIHTGDVSCGDCHDPHTGKVIAGTGASLESQNETCTKCHTAQKGPFTFKHSAMKEGCVSCHNPHGSVNQKMFVARDSNLCLSCHLETATTPGIILAGGEDHRTRMMNGTCWVAGCHEAVHGSHTSPALRY